MRQWLASGILTVVVALLAGCEVATIPGGRGSDDGPQQGPVINGTVTGQLLAGQGTASREMAHPVGVAGQRVSLVDASRGNIVATTTTASDGGFSMSVTGGTYILDSNNIRQYVKVTAGEQIRVNLMTPVP
jgi:hypothetical protein